MAPLSLLGDMATMIIMQLVCDGSSYREEWGHIMITFDNLYLLLMIGCAVMLGWRTLDDQFVVTNSSEACGEAVHEVPI